MVAPDAEVKVYLTADPSARAERRTAENGAGSVEATQADLLRRDRIDSGRAVAPAMMPDGAVHIDTTPYSLDEVVDQVVEPRPASGAGETTVTGALRIDGGELPSTDGVRAPHTRLITAGRFVPAAIIRTWWNLEIHGAENVPRTGPVVMAANHVGWLDGPLLAICAPRPVHALTKMEMFSHGMGAFLVAVGQIPLDRFHVDVTAIRVAVKSLEDGLCVGVFPEGHARRRRHGLAARGCGLPLPRHRSARRTGGVPRDPGARHRRHPAAARDPAGDDLRRTRRPGQPPWPRTQQDMADAAARVTDAILKTIHTAENETGMTLPGPLGPKPVKKRR